MKKKIIDVLTTLGLLATLLLGSAATQVFATGTSASLRFVQTPTITLYASISASATSMRITPYPKDLDGTKLTITDFGSSPTVTIDPKVRNIEEIVGFTGITDNGDNTATLTGLTRNLTSKYPYTTVGTGRQHTASAVVVFSNNPQMYARLTSWENPGTTTAVWTFSSTTKPVYDANPSFGASDGNAFVNYSTLLATAISGAGTSTEGAMGIVRLASNGQTGIASSTTGAPYVIPNRLSTSTYNPCCAMQGNVVSLNSSKNIDANFIATSSSNTYNYGATMNLNGTTTVTALGGFLVTGTSTMQGTTTQLGNFIANNVFTTYTSATTTTTFPLPITMSTSTGKVSTGNSAQASSSVYFLGFSKANATNNTPLNVQTSGIVSGFSGLTTGSDYYIQDGGSIGTTIGTVEAYVGTAVSSTQLLMGQPRAFQYSGITGSCTSLNAPSWTRMATISLTWNSGVSNETQESTIYRSGKTTVSFTFYSQNGGGGSIESAGASASWSGNTITSGSTCTAYLYY